MREVDFLLVGGGMASAYCASELRRQGADGSVLLVGRESDPPYERPPLSKEYLRGDAERADAVVNGADWYAENDVELLSGKSVMSLDPAERVAKIQGGEEVRFSKALLATGAMVNIVRVEGAELEGIHYLRAFGNSDSIRDEAGKAEKAVLIGGSYIGCEVAASLTEMGVKCTIVMQEDVTLSNGFGEEAGRFFQDILESKGVEVVGGTGLGSFSGDERVGAVVTEDGREIECDFVVMGTGVRPDVMLAQRGGLEVDNGVACDAKLETSVEGIFAAGDCCSYEVGGARPAPARGALGCCSPAGPACGARDAGRHEPLHGDPVLLQRPVRLGRARVRGPGKGLGRGRDPRVDGRRRVFGLVPEGRLGRRRPRGRPLGGSDPRPQADRIGRATCRRQRGELGDADSELESVGA